MWMVPPFIPKLFLFGKEILCSPCLLRKAQKSDSVTWHSKRELDPTHFSSPTVHCFLILHFAQPSWVAPSASSPTLCFSLRLECSSISPYHHPASKHTLWLFLYIENLIHHLSRLRSTPSEKTSCYRESPRWVLQHILYSTLNCSNSPLFSFECRYVVLFIFLLCY